MNKSEKEKSSEKDDGEKNSMLSGIFYFILGLLGLAFSIFSGYYDFENIVPLFGTVIAGILIGALSILIIIYGYRIMRKDI